MTRDLPDDPIIRQLIAQARRTQLSRRHVLQGAGIGATALALAACSTPGGGADLKPAKDDSASDKNLVWANWASYLDEDDDGNHPTLDRFIDDTGIKVDYRVDVDDNNSYYAKVKDQLAAGQDIGADTVCLTEWMVSRLVRLNYVQTLDHDKIPNIKNLTPALADPDFDPGRKHSLPWQGGYAGIAWNTEEVDAVPTVEDLWRSDLKGRVGVLSEMRDTIGLIMLQQGVDIAGDWGTDEFKSALDVFRKQVKDGQIRNVKGNSYLDDLQSGDTLAAICWSGDITTLNAEVGYDKWKFVIPEAGGTIWNDTFVVPMGSTRKTNAETLMNYYYEPEVAAEVAAWVNYVTPVSGPEVLAAASAIDPALAENQLIFPNEDTLKTVHVFRTLGPEEEQAFQSEFQTVLLGG